MTNNIPKSSKEFKFHVFKDGDMFCALLLDFKDLQESPAGFGETEHLALMDLIYRENKAANEKAWLHDEVMCLCGHRWIAVYHAHVILQEHDERYLDKGIAEDDVADMINGCTDLEELKDELRKYFNILMSTTAIRRRG